MPPEFRFDWIYRNNGGVVKEFSFGYDRDRSVNFDDEVFYLQHIREEEMEELRKRGLI